MTPPLEAELNIRPMTLDDLEEVLAIDRLSFPIPWSERTYRYELTSNSAARLLVADYRYENRVVLVGYIGFWFVVDEVHISTLAVHPSYRRRGIGVSLLREVLSMAYAKGGVVATLEVRTSNEAAVHMYKRHGFEIAGRRLNYYQDNREDAWIMVLNSIEPVWAVAGGANP